MLKYSSEGVEFIAQIKSPLIDKIWNIQRDTADSDSAWVHVDWAALDAIAPKLSIGERAVVDLGKSLAGRGTVNVCFALGQIDGYLRDLYQSLQGRFIGKLVR